MKIKSFKCMVMMRCAVDIKWSNTHFYTPSSIHLHTLGSLVCRILLLHHFLHLQLTTNDRSVIKYPQTKKKKKTRRKTKPHIFVALNSTDAQRHTIKIIQSQIYFRAFIKTNSLNNNSLSTYTRFLLFRFFYHPKKIWY